MKNIGLCAVIIAVMLTLLACVPTGNTSAGKTDADTTGAAASKGGQFKVGYGIANVTPEGTGLSYQSGDRVNTGISSYLYAICTAMTDADGNTAIVISVDTMLIYGPADDVMEWIIEEYGIPMENICICATHTHTAPEWTNSNNGAYDLLVDGMKQAVKDAMEDRAPAEMYINTVQTQALNFVRHYIANDPAGSSTSDNYNEVIVKEYGIKEHRYEPDNNMQLLKFVREGKEPIILVNYQAHPMNGYSSTGFHSDFIGVMRDKVADELDAKVIYVSGASGNLSTRTRIESDLSYDVNDWKAHGEKAAKYVIKAEDGYTKVNTGKIKAKLEVFAYPVDHSLDEYAELAQTVYDLSKQDGAAATALINEKYADLFSSYHHAMWICRRAKYGETMDNAVYAISIGDVAFTCHQYEMFDTNGLEVKNGTIGNANYAEEEQMGNPYAMTIVATMSRTIATRSHNSYISSAYGYEYGSYEADSTVFVPGTGEKLVTEYLKMLNELHGEE